MINKFQTTVIKVMTNDKIKKYCTQNNISIGTMIKKALEDIHNINPCIIFKRKIKLDSYVSVRINHLEHEKYSELKNYLTAYGIGLLFYDYIINHETYMEVNQKAIDLNNNFIDNMSEIDKRIMHDESLTQKEKTFLVELDMQSKEALYYDRELLKNVISESEI